jgi:alkyl sulfatase BDS1-like metallo-beta-lactamase superfamily hydrolase
MVMYFPQFGVPNAAEFATHNMHNLYTLIVQDPTRASEPDHVTKIGKHDAEM